MPNKKIADLISKTLRDGNLVHPGRDGGPPTPIALPMFRTAGMPPEMAELVSNTADLLAEVLVAVIENEGDSEIVDRERAALLDVPDETPRKVVTVHCRCDKTGRDPLLVLNATNRSRITVDGKQLLKGLIGRDIECPHERKP